MQPIPGKPFGPYLVEHPVGQGGMGAVYRARDPRLARPVALKVMLDDETGEIARTRFLREGRLAAALEHPNIVRILDVGSVEGTPYLAMEWIDGKTLKSAKVDRPIELLAEIAETLAFAHEHGVIHRDLKPANVIVDAQGRPRLVDFGIARRVAPAGTFATRDGAVLGTPSYMAPEQELTSAVDARADQYSWGVMAYELLTGDRPTRPALAHAALDPRYAPIVLRALSEAPSQRFPTMRDLLAAWRAVPPIAAAPPAPPPPLRARGKLRVLFGTAGAVAAVGCIGLAIGIAARSSPAAPAVSDAGAMASARATAPIDAIDAIDAAPVSLPSASSVAAEDAAPPSASKPRATARAGPRTIAEMTSWRVEGAANVDLDALQSELHRTAPAVARCVVGRRFITDTTELRGRFEPDEPPVVEFYKTHTYANTDGTSALWPPEDVQRCLADVVRSLKIVATGNRSAAAYFFVVVR